MKKRSEKRILVVTHQLSRTGAPLVLLDMIDTLRKHEYQVDVISMLEGDLRGTLEGWGISVEIQERFMEASDRFSERACCYDLVIANTLITYEVIHILNGTRIPVLWWLHEGRQYFDYFTAVLPDFGRLGENIHVFSVGHYVQEVIREKYHVDTALLHFGIRDVPGKGESRQTGKKVKFLTAGTYSKVKAQDVLAAAVRLLPQSYQEQAEFYFCGSQEVCDEEVFAAVRQLEMDFDNVHIRPQQPHDAMLALMEECDCLIAPSRIDPMPTVAAEMMMKEGLCLLTDVCGVAHYVQDGVSGYTVPPENPKELAAKLLHIIDCREKWSAVQKAGRGIYEKHFSMEVFEPRVLELADIYTHSEIGAVCFNGQETERTLAFEDILLDETLVAGEVWVKREALQKAGGINRKLSGKRTYELLLRIAQEYTVISTERETQSWPEIQGGNWILLREEESDAHGGIQTDCYLIGRYKDTLLSMGVFDDAVLGVLSAGNDTTTEYLKKMLVRSEEYYRIYDATQPVLIYTGEETCYGVLNEFAQNLGDALERQGAAVEYFDLSRHSYKDLYVYVGKRFRAIVGMQTYLFSVKMEDDSFLHDKMEAPLFHFVFDHPIRMRNHLEEMPARECVLTLDRNYVGFIETYYNHRAKFLPPGGCCAGWAEANRKEYGISFLGSYGEGVLKYLKEERQEDREWGHLMSRYVLYMKKHLQETPESVFEKTLEYYGISCTKEEFLERFHRARWASLRLANHYRNKVVAILLKEGIKLHVFGDSWKRSPLWGHPGLIWHEAVTGEEALKVYARSRLSLNIMTWHKDGFTERIANAMLQRSVVVTDRTTYLEQNFEDEKELLMFDLAEMERLPARIKELLSDEEHCKQIAQAGYQKAAREHTWDDRAGTLLKWISEDCLS